MAEPRFLRFKSITRGDDTKNTNVCSKKSVGKSSEVGYHTIINIEGCESRE